MEEYLRGYEECKEEVCKFIEENDIKDLKEFKRILKQKLGR